MQPEDIYFNKYFKKTLTFNFWKHNLVFRTSQELFSSHSVDLGTQFLLRTLVEAGYTAPRSLLDLGCGYGPLGLTLGKIYPGCMVHLVDRDALAVEYARQNAELNGLTGTQVFGSLGYDDLKQSAFDMIVSNIPGKAGETVISYLLKEAGCHLTPGGLAAVVVVEALDELVSSILHNTAGLEIVLKRTRPGHSVFHFRFSGLSISRIPSETAIERGVYLRNSRIFSYADCRYSMQTAYGLPEFDSLDYRSELLLKALSDRTISGSCRVAVFNPGQGYAAVRLWDLVRPQSIDLIDRDLLALRYTRLNLILNRCPAEIINISHQAGLESVSPARYDLIAGVLREEEGPGAVELALSQAAAELSAGGLVLAAASSTAITRLAVWVRRNPFLRVLAREKSHGYSLLVLANLSGS